MQIYKRIFNLFTEYSYIPNHERREPDEKACSLVSDLLFNRCNDNRNGFCSNAPGTRNMDPVFSFHHPLSDYHFNRRFQRPSSWGMRGKMPEQICLQSTLPQQDRQKWSVNLWTMHGEMPYLFGELQVQVPLISPSNTKKTSCRTRPWAWQDVLLIRPSLLETTSPVDHKRKFPGSSNLR